MSAHSTGSDSSSVLAGEAIAEFVAVIGRLRRECSWKAAQTHATLARYLLEETYETLEVLDSGDLVGVREELGDLLLQVVLHSAIAEQAGDFDFADVVGDITAKMIRRNPHVFGDAPVAGLTPDEVNDAWQAVKATEKVRASVLDGIPDELPALLWADKVAERLERAGAPVEAAASDDVGEQLLALVLRAQADGVDPEQALRRAVRARINQS